MECKVEIALSIIIPVYNTQAYLGRCLRSVENAVHGWEDYVEVLVINDGSTDDSSLVIDSFCQKNSYMKGFNKSNGGLSDVKNYGLARAIGKYVIFLDSDDYIEPDMYKNMLGKLEEENADVAVCDMRLVYDDPVLNWIYSCAVASKPDSFSQVTAGTMMTSSCNKMVKRSLYSGLTFPVGFNNEDVSVTPIILARAQKIIIINEPYYNYYQRSGSIQVGKFNEKRFVILKTAKMCIDRLDNIEQEKQEKIRGSLYLHQILAIALYPIRKEKFKNRYILLKKYMEEVYSLFPDIWNNSEVLESLTWDDHVMQAFRKYSRFLLMHRQYFLTCIFWTLINTAQKLMENMRK